MLSTKEAADIAKKKPQTLRAAYCLRGHYYGVVPEKLPDGSLLWPANFLEQLVAFAERNGVTDRAKKAREVKAAKRAAAMGASQGGAA